MSRRPASNRSFDDFSCPKMCLCAFNLTRIPPIFLYIFYCSVLILVAIQCWPESCGRLPDIPCYAYNPDRKGENGRPRSKRYVKCNSKSNPGLHFVIRTMRPTQFQGSEFHCGIYFTHASVQHSFLRIPTLYEISRAHLPPFLLCGGTSLNGTPHFMPRKVGSQGVPHDARGVVLLVGPS